jgi:hypothetical protein
VKTRKNIREPGRVVMHLNGGFTRVEFERTVGLGMANGGAYWDVPTERIPFHLRSIGSRFVIVDHGLRPEAHDSAGAIRSAVYAFEIEELTESGLRPTPLE